MKRIGEPRGGLCERRRGPQSDAPFDSAPIIVGAAKRRMPAPCI